MTAVSPTNITLNVKPDVPTFDLDDPIRATVDLREKYGIPQGNGTVIEIIVSREDVKMPQYNNLRNYLQRHFELRPIMSNPNRKIILRDIASDGKLRQEHELSYKSPLGEKVLEETLPVKAIPPRRNWKSIVRISNCPRAGRRATTPTAACWSSAATSSFH